MSTKNLLPLASNPRQPDEVDKSLFGLAFFSFLLLCFLAYNYFTNAGIINVNNITTVENCIITERVRRERTSGKNPDYYYVFKLRGHNLECRFFDDYYDYSNGTSFIRALRQWDTVSIQIFTSDLEFWENPYSKGKINIVNLAIHGRFLVDHGYRNAQVSKSNKTNLYALMLVVTAFILLIFLKSLYHTLKFRLSRKATGTQVTENPD